MTEKQKLFCDEYLKDLNGTRAYRTVYKTIKNDNVAGVRANKLLKQKDIAEYINKRLEEIHNENTANIQEVMEYLTSVMRGTSKANVLALAGDGYQEVIAKPPDEKERLKAAELLGKRFGMFKDNVDITSNGKTVIVDDIDEG
ncbi:terminase small subunit [Coprobacillus sp. AF37-2]|jgi:phage terminase small subunit|uniref:terminase small subunit n=1 Tax=Faecalibacillus intestinalis TaxID=1982626 RepID=UPI000E5364EF|nr:terminase small subunit [Faecalibacillus intestinalis]MZK56088.1 terminase small subunit [Coprobacillus sp. BIOML-A1]RGF47870.1 terminase small subunit [Coprobacillus sp. AF37-2]